MRALIAVLPATASAPRSPPRRVRALEAVAQRFGHAFELRAARLVGGAAIDATGEALPPATLDAVPARDAVLLGAVGGPKWSDPNAQGAAGAGAAAAAQGARAVRQPAPGRAAPGACSTPRRIKPELLRGVDIMVVRELTGGIYFGDEDSAQPTDGERPLPLHGDRDRARRARSAAQLARARRGAS